ncbi:MAG: tRNA preQ1(34) S-adenosylmethionine ribosyltransferase-isomerase QueA [bacterium]
MKLADFNYTLPPGYIAQNPLPKRDASKLMVIEKDSGTITHRIFRNLTDYLDKGDVLVVNDTKVIPARLLGRKEHTGAKIEVFLLKKLKKPNEWETLIRPGRRVKEGTRIIFSPGKFEAQLLKKTPQGRAVVRFHVKGSFDKALARTGHTPLPPYINEKTGDNSLRERYQTVYAQKKGAVAAPTAGLHFTKGLIKKIEDKKVKVVNITLHTGLGTFSPVRDENITRHKMEEEYFEIPSSTARAVINAKRKGSRVIAVGTTAVRALETAFDKDMHLEKNSGMSRLFIYPGYRFKVVDALVTNFHLPKSTLLMLVSAFSSPKEHPEKGIGLIRKAYRQAIEEKYRFFSFGDAMIIL